MSRVRYPRSWSATVGIPSAFCRAPMRRRRPDFFDGRMGRPSRPLAHPVPERRSDIGRRPAVERRDQPCAGLSPAWRSTRPFPAGPSGRNPSARTGVPGPRPPARLGRTARPVRRRSGQGDALATASAAAARARDGGAAARIRDGGGTARPSDIGPPLPPADRRTRSARGIVTRPADRRAGWPRAAPSVRATTGSAPPGAGPATAASGATRRTRWAQRRPRLRRGHPPSGR